MVLAAALLALSPAAAAQRFVPAPVEISNKVIEVEGRSFYVHSVVAKQTLYSICKAYGADINEVRQINSITLSGGLKAGSLLLIPMAEPAQESDQKLAGKEPEQTAEALQDQDTVPDDDGDGQYILHRVRWYDSLLMLSLKYGISVDDIMKANNLTSSTLMVGQTLRIPVKGDVSATEIDDNAILDDDLDEFPESRPKLTIVDNEEDTIDVPKPVFVPFSGTANMTLMLPFAARSGEPSDIFMDFYAGVLMALEDLRKDGTNINLKVIDMSDFDSAEQMFEESGLEGQDFVIGNFALESIDEAADWCDAHFIPLVSPLDQKIEAATYNHKFLVNAQLSTATQTMRLAEYINFTPGRDNIVVICENGDQQGAFHNDAIQALDSLDIPYALIRSGIGRSLGDNIKNALKSGKTNHIIITSEKESVAAEAVRNVGLLARGGDYNIVGYASHKIRRFDSIDSDLLKRMNAHFIVGYNVDYTDENVRNFVRKYRALYNTEPGNFAFQGYDIAVYFVNALKRYGSDMINGIAGYPAEGLQLNFRFDRRNAWGGMFNEATKNVVY